MGRSCSQNGGRYKCLWGGLGVDGRTMDLEEIGINAGNWVDSAQIGIIEEPL